MAVSQRFIDLLNMPAPALRRLAVEREVDLGTADGKWDVARAVARALSRDELEEASDGYLYAGSTSMSWFRLVSAVEDIDYDDARLYYPLEGDDVELDELKAALAAHAEGDPFDERDRPDEITNQPKLVLAREWRDGVLMTFAIAKRLTQVIHNFELVEVLEDEFFAAFLRPHHGTFEVRSSSARAERLRAGWLDDFADSLGFVVVPVEITQRDVRALRDEIGGRLAKYGGSESSGTRAIGTVTFGKADHIDDLFDDEEFEEATAGYDPVAYDLLFDYQDEEDVRLHISTLRGSVFIRTAVPESVVRYLYAAMRTAKSP
jgi:hypothetical protein